MLWHLQPWLLLKILQPGHRCSHCWNKRFKIIHFFVLFCLINKVNKVRRIFSLLSTSALNNSIRRQMNLITGKRIRPRATKFLFSWIRQQWDSVERYLSSKITNKSNNDDDGGSKYLQFKFVKRDAWISNSSTWILF
jgi:hypothetical protein